MKKACEKALDYRAAAPVTDTYGAGLCLGATEAARNTLLLLSDSYPGVVCMPENGVTNRQGIAIAQRFFREHPEWLDSDATPLLVQAYRTAFACKKQ